ncbi:MAG: hypothetical protein ACRDKS_05915, partial [Actinomycetota bacterium]
MRLPIRLRLTLAFAVAMALVLSAFGWYLYLRVGSDLMDVIDLNLRARGGSILEALRAREPLPIGGEHTLIEADEAFAQVLDAQGRILETSPAVAAAPMLPADDLASVDGPRLFIRRVVGTDDP